MEAMETVRNFARHLGFFALRKKTLERIAQSINHGKECERQFSLSGLDSAENVSSVRMGQAWHFNSSKPFEDWLTQKNTQDDYELGFAHVTPSQSVHSFAVAVLKEPPSQGGKNIVLAVDAGAYGKFDKKHGGYDTSSPMQGKTAYQTGRFLQEIGIRNPHMRGMVVGTGVQFDSFNCAVFAGQSVEAMMAHPEHLARILKQVPKNAERFNPYKNQVSSDVFHQDTQGRFFATNNVNFLITGNEHPETRDAKRSEGKAFVEKLIERVQSRRQLNHLRRSSQIDFGVEASRNAIAEKRLSYVKDGKKAARGSSMSQGR